MISLSLPRFFGRNMQSVNALDALTVSSSRIDMKESVLPSKSRAIRSTKVAHRRTPSTIATQTCIIPEVMCDEYCCVYVGAASWVVT